MFVPLIPAISAMSIEHGEISLVGKPEYARDELILEVKRNLFDKVELYYFSELGEGLPQIVNSRRKNEEGRLERVFQLNVRGTEAAKMVYDLYRIRYRIFHPEMRLED